MGRHFYVFLIPVVWMIIDVINFQYPGDEYGGWAAGSLPGLWILLIIKNEGSPWGLLPYLVGAGGLVMASLGWWLDKLRAPMIPWAVLTAVIALAVGTYALSSFPSWERAIGKNGSVQAYILPSVNFGILAATLGMIVVMSLVRLFEVPPATGAKGVKSDPSGESSGV